MSREITIVVPTSPIKSHPSTAIIEQTVESIRRALPESPLIITCDGVPPKLERYRAQYDEFKSRLDDLWPNSTVIKYPDHVHQCEMMGIALTLVLTEFVFYLESDWEILPHVQWERLTAMIREGRFNSIKLHANPRIHPLHEFMMGHRQVIQYDEEYIGWIETRQWSQNPHLASTHWYRRIWDQHLRGKYDFIENQLVGPIGQSPWDDYKVAVYNPIDYGMQRVKHLDGREGDEQ